MGQVFYNGTGIPLIVVTGSGTFNPAQLDFTAYDIPGRNGSVLISNNRYKDIDVTYPFFIPRQFTDRVQEIRNWFNTTQGYAKLTDTYDTTHFRYGMGTSIEFEPIYKNKGANGSMTFRCHPERYDVFLDSWISIEAGHFQGNSTPFVWRPLIRVTNPTQGGYIEISNNGTARRLTATASYTGTVYIDCDLMTIYSGASNLNYLFEGDFPLLEPGSNAYDFSGVSTPQIKRRGWEL